MISNEEIDQLATAYIQHYSNPIIWDTENVATVRDNEDTFWAVERILDITHKNPEDLWEIILEILRRDPPSDVIQVLAAGPMEEYLARCGDSVICRVESRAATDPKFRDLLGGVWKNKMSAEMWARVQACRGRPW